jgi:hypothetical protein
MEKEFQQYSEDSEEAEYARKTRAKAAESKFGAKKGEKQYQSVYYGSEEESQNWSGEVYEDRENEKEALGSDVDD